jgi:protoheme IX farnesyltransferase
VTPGPGAWLRLTALGASAASAVVVVTGEAEGITHNVAALVALVLLAAVALAAWLVHRDRPALTAAATTALGVFKLQIALGGLLALTDAVWLKGLHVGLGALSLGACVIATALTFPREPRAQARGSRKDYVTLTKPRIMTLLLLTAAGGMAVGARGLPSLGLFLATMGGLALACGGASALNHVLDRDIDVHMKRTDRRPVATGRIPPAHALEFGLALSALSFVVLTSFVNVLAALLAVCGNLFYVLVYTRWLKRATPQNIVIGGAAGAVPPLVGWAAATGNLTVPALFLFLIVFLWTPPHFWALALLIKRDYAAAKVPMLPVVKGERETARSIVRYSLALVLVSLLPVVWETLGWVYLGAALVLGALFLALSLSLRRRTDPLHARRLFSYSLSYLALLFVAMSLDPILLG